jgi:hypothetical protein
MTVCDRRNRNNCIFKDYKNNNNGACVNTADSSTPYSIPGLNNYSQGEFTNWLTALYNRDIGKDKSRSEAANIYEYAERCRDVPGYDFLRGLNFTNPNPPLATKADISGRYVRITTNNLGDNVWLQLAEVVVLRNGINIAQDKPSNAKTVGFGGEPRRANDGNSDGNYNNNSVYHSGVTDGRPRGPEYWEVDLGSEELIDRIIVYNRTDCCSGRMIDWLVTISNNSKKPVWNRIYPVPPNPKTMIEPRASNNDMRNPLIKNYEVNKFNEYFTKVKDQNLYVAKVGWEGHCAEQCHIDICQNAGKKWIGNNNWYACRDKEPSDDDAELFNKINSWLPGGNKIGNLLYKASRDGWSPQKFHELCDSAFGTITIARLTDGRLIGGYNPVYWNGTGYKNPDDAFLFDNNEKYMPIGYAQNNYSIYCSPNYYPTFGGGHDFYINPSKSLQNNSWTYKNPSNNAPLGNKWNKIIYHSINDLEVYAMQESACQKHTRENTCNKRFPWWFSKTCCVGETPVCFNGSYWYPLKEPGSGYTWHTEGWLNPCDGPVKKCLPERCGR